MAIEANPEAWRGEPKAGEGQGGGKGEGARAGMKGQGQPPEPSQPPPPNLHTPAPRKQPNPHPPLTPRAKNLFPQPHLSGMELREPNEKSGRPGY